MGSDLASVLWDVLDGYNFYKNFKMTAISNDRRGLPKPVNRSLFFDEADSEDEQAFNESYSPEHSQCTGTLTWWTVVRDFIVARVHDCKDSVTVCTNSTKFFYRKIHINRWYRLISGFILLIVLPISMAGLLETAIIPNLMDLFGGKESATLLDTEKSSETVSHRGNSTTETIHVIPDDPEIGELSLNGDNLSDKPGDNNGDASESIMDIETCRHHITVLSKKLQENELTWDRLLHTQSRSIEALKQQISNLEKTFQKSEVLSGETSHATNERFENWQQSISRLARQTERSVSALKKNVDIQFAELAGRTSLVDTFESKMTKIAEEFTTMKSTFQKKIIDLQDLVKDSSISIIEENSLLTAVDVREIVKKETEEKGGKVNWIIGVSAHSPTHKDSFFSLPILGHSLERTPESTVIKKGCWPMDGSKGFIEYHLADKVLVQILTLEHLHKSRRIIMGSVPKHFRVEGSPDDGVTWLNLGSHTYDADGPAVQHFNIEQTSESVKTIKLSIQSNYGEQYTCLYGVAIHGKRST